MSETTPVRADAVPPPALAIREGTLEDLAAVASAVSDLLVELGGEPAPIPALEEAARTLVEDPEAGVLLVADAGGELAGVLGVSWQHAMRVPGRYGLVQELWVRPSWRGRTVGGDLLLALFDRARARGVSRLEVGLPSERFPHLAATEAFYLNNGFATIGQRMRRLL